jgi:hypothetical protein
MVRNGRRHTVILYVELLERRDAPSASPTFTESFDTTPVGSLPSGWSQWSNISGDGTFAVESTLAYSAPNGLAVTANASRDVARAWLNAGQAPDVQVSTDVYLNTLIPAQVIARGSNLNTASPTYYDLSIARGLDLQLNSVVNGVSTTLADLKSAGYISSQWAAVTLYVSGNNVRAQVERLDQYQRQPDRLGDPAAGHGYHRRVDPVRPDHLRSSRRLEDGHDQRFGSSLLRPLPHDFQQRDGSRGQHRTGTRLRRRQRHHLGRHPRL